VRTTEPLRAIAFYLCLGVFLFSPFHPLTLSPFNLFPFSPFHPFTLSPSVLAQSPSQPRPGVGPADRPVVNAEAADRGRHVWAVECITCHGAQARGTDSGPNLIRSAVVLKDRYGSELGPYLKKGHPLQSGKPGASLTDEQVTDLTHFLRERIEDTLRGAAVFTPHDILTGDASEGRRYFEGSGGCTKCHSATGDFAGLATRNPNPVDVQQRMLFPTGRGRGSGPNPAAVRVTVTPASGAAITGVLVQMDDFYVTFRDNAGATRVIKRSPGMTVAKTDPLETHHRLLRTITDQNIHDVVAYLVTLK
jgi:mono/diheme cytochrome c family protein